MSARLWNLDHFIFEEYKTDTAALGIYRIVFAGYILTCLPKHLWISAFPNSFFDPPLGPFWLFSGFPNPALLLAVNGLMIVSAVCLLFGYRTRIASISFPLLLLLCDGWGYSIGKIDHHDVTLVFIPLVMQFAGWGNAYSLDSIRGGLPANEEKTTGWPLALMALMIGMMMMTAAVPKAATGWLDPHVSAVRAHMLDNLFVTGRANWLAEDVLRIQSRVFWKACDYGTVAMEAAFLLTVLRRRAFRIVCALACLFHCAIALTMEIAFVGNILAYAAVMDWRVPERLARAPLRMWSGMLTRISGPVVLGSGAAFAFVYLRLGNPLQLQQPEDPLGVFICVAASAVAIAFLVRSVRELVPRRRDTVAANDMLPAGFENQALAGDPPTRSAR